MHISLADLIIQHLLEPLSLMDFHLGRFIIIQFSDSESDSLLFVHLPELCLLMQSNLKLFKKGTYSKSVCFFFLKNFSYYSSMLTSYCFYVSYVKSFRLFS